MKTSNQSRVEPSPLRFRLRVASPRQVAAPGSRAVFAALRRARESSARTRSSRIFRLCHPSLVTRHPSPVTRHPSPVTRHPSPVTRHPSPVTRHPSPVTRHPSPVTRHPSHSRAFTIIELLVVISILGIMAALTVPVLKNFAKSDATLGASRQLLDGVARARQLAMSQRTTVYMVFVPTNFWANTGWLNSLTPAQQTAATNLCDKQLTGYTFVSLSSVGDQPGQHVPHYLAPWQTLPDNTFIVLAKFANSPNNYYTITDPIDATKFYNIYGFATNATFPFPTETAVPWIQLPYIAFNYVGQLTVDGQTVAGQDEYIPIAKGSVLVARDSFTKAFQFNPPDVAENPPGNSTNSYNIVHIDRLTGRAVLEYQKVQ